MRLLRRLITHVHIIMYHAQTDISYRLADMRLSPIGA